jgi:hypothetical protein
MSTAQCYTNRVRVLSQARNNKVQQVKNIADGHSPLQAAACVTPNYSYINYRLPPYCGGNKPRCLKQ